MPYDIQAEPPADDWLLLVEDRYFDALAAFERTRDDRVFAEQAEAEAERDVQMWERIRRELSPGAD